jgi:hypothetical protein
MTKYSAVICLVFDGYPTASSFPFPIDHANFVMGMTTDPLARTKGVPELIASGKQGLY